MLHPGRMQLVVLSDGRHYSMIIIISVIRVKKAFHMQMHAMSFATTLRRYSLRRRLWPAALAMLSYVLDLEGAIAAEEELAQYLARHEQALRAIRSVYLEMEVVTRIEGQEWVTESIKWRSDGIQERQSDKIIASPKDVPAADGPREPKKAFMIVGKQRVYYPENANRTIQALRAGPKVGEVIQQHEVAVGPHEVRELTVARGTDGPFALRTPLSPADPGSVDFDRVQGFLKRRNHLKRHTMVPVRLLLALTFSYNLSEAVAASDSVTAAVDAEGFVRITLRFARDNPELHGAREVTCILSPKAGYLIQKVEFSNGGGREVLEFGEVQPGIFFPKRVAGIGARDSAPQIEFRVKHIEVNRPVRDEEFVLTFPEGAQVVDITGPTIRYHLWGQNDRSVSTFHTFDEYEAWYKRQSTVALEKMGVKVPSDPRGPRWRDWALIGGNLLLIAALAVLFFVRRQLVRRKSLAEQGDERATRGAGDR